MVVSSSSWVTALLRAPRVPGNSRPHPIWQPTKLTHPEHAGAELPAPARGLLHHLLHVAELLEQAVDLRDGAPAPLGHAGPPRSVHDSRFPALLGRHREDDGFEVLHPLGVG